MFETREQVLEKIMDQAKPACCDCEQEMNLWEVPPINFSDGLGWGSPYLYVCFNDECPAYKQGWDNLRENYSHMASYRRMCYPGTDQYELMPVFSPVGGTGQIIDDQVLLDVSGMNRILDFDEDARFDVASNPARLGRDRLRRAHRGERYRNEGRPDPRRRHLHHAARHR